MDLLKVFGSKAQTKLVQHLLENPTRVYNQAGLARFLRCSPSTVSRVIEPLIEEGIVICEQLPGQMKVIAFNMKSDKAKALLEFYEKIRKL